MWNIFKLNNKNTRDDVNEAGLVIFLLTLNKYMLAYAYHKKTYPWFNHNYANNRIYRIVACYSIKQHNHFSIYDILLIWS